MTTETATKARVDLESIINAVDATGADVIEIGWSCLTSTHSYVIARDCASYTTLCDHFKAPRNNGRRLGSERHRDVRHVYDALGKTGVLIQHTCWPHLPCWDTP